MAIPKRDDEPKQEQQIQVISDSQLLHLKLDEILSYLRKQE